MRRWAIGWLLAATLAFAAPALAGATPELEMYTVEVDAATAAKIVTAGYDVAATEAVATDRIRIDLVLTAREGAKLAREGLAIKVTRDAKGRTATQRAALQAASGFQVWRSWDEPGGLRDELYRLAARHPQIVQLHVLGKSHEGREIIALRLTQGARDVPVGTRPAVLYQATTHAREWISTEVARRLLRWYVDQWPRNRTVREILSDRELWFIPVLNPDGYQYTFDHERLWRKNTRDNDGDGETTGGDGVDLNRNYPEHWSYDQEGSSSQPSSEVYRGPAAASEPETQANIELFDRVDLRFAISYHSFGQLLLYPQGWQVQTPSADDPIYVALTGTDDAPAVAGFDPGVGADLYTTNGEFTDWAHGTRGTLAWTPELSEGCEDCGFVFPDDESLIEAEFRRNLDFAVNVARSALDPDDPVSHAGIDTRGLYLDLAEIDPWKAHNPASDLTVDVSYAGSASQDVEVLAKRALGDVTLHYSVNAGPPVASATAESPAGERYGGNNAYNTYYHYLRGTIPGLAVGDSVEYWFEGGGEATDRVPFEVVEDADADVLVLAAEDRTGAVNLPPYTSATAPNYLATYEAALAANGLSADVYDVDAMGRETPDHLGVLSHYDVVVWYSGNDLVTRQADRGPGNVARLANDLVLEVRAYLNEGGKLLYTGQWAGATENGVAGLQFYDPVADEACVVDGALVLERCQLLADKNDFLQYYLGAYVYNSDAGTDPASGEPFPVVGVAEPYGGAGWSFNGADSAGNQIHTASFLTASSILHPGQYPQFASTAPAVWDTGSAGRFDPYDGDWYVYSDIGDVSYKRLARAIDLTGVSAADAPTLTFRFSYDTEFHWDFVFVEAHTVGRDDWTTLPDLNGHTSADTGDSCPSGWFELHPWLERYQGSDCSGSNASAGGEWHASSGRSLGWEEWQVDLSAYAGEQVELAVSYASDWAFQGLGAFVDLVAVSTGEGSTSFETGLDGWTVPGPPDGSAPNPNDWERSESVGFDEGAVVATDDTLLFGFGFEGIEGAGERADVMGRAMGYLLGP